MNYLQITNWDKWQTYRKDRGQPPWIKVHRRLMRNPEWVSLSDSERGQLICLWLLAADKEGSIPNDPDVIKNLCYMTKAPNINKFMELGFVTPDGSQDGVKMASSGSQRDQPKAEAEAEAEKKRKEYSLYFEKFFWNHYPNHNGKKSAFLEFKKIPEEIYKTFPEIIKAQVKSKALKKSNGGFVPEWPDPERWLKKARWEDDIEIPTTSTPGPPTEKIPHHCEKCKAKTHLLEKDDSGKYLCPTCRGAKSYSEFTGDPGASIEALIGKAFNGGNGDESDTKADDEQDRVRQLRDQAAVSGKQGEIDDVPY